jgi:hypothetical protein
VFGHRPRREDKAMNENESSGEESRDDGGTALVEIIVIEIIDLEEHARSGRRPPRAHRYRIRIDKEYKEVEAHGLTGRQILHLVGKTPEGYLLSQKSHGGRVDPVKADQYVDFTTHGIERFQTLALDPTEG